MKLIPSQVADVLRKTLVQNVLALYGVYAVNYLIPLVTVPYLTRVLGVEGWGRYAFYQSIAFYALLIVEYSFITYGTREVSRRRADANFRGEILAGVIGAKAMLAAAVLAAAAFAYAIVPELQRNALLFGFAIGWAITLGFSLIWYFQGLERMKLAASLDVSTKVLATASIFILVRAQGEEWKIFAIYCVANLLSFSVALGLCFRDTPIRWPRLTWATRVLREGWALFAARANIALYTTGNVFILGLMVSPTEVGYFAGAEKISRAFGSLCGPISQSLFPRLSHVTQEDRPHAVSLVRKSLLVLGGLGLSFALFLFLGSPLICRYFLGPAFGPSRPLLRILALLPIMISLSNVFGTQWMLALGLDKAYNRLTIIAAALNLGSAILFIHLFGATGMAWTCVLVETFVTTSIYLVLRKRQLHPV